MTINEFDVLPYNRQLALVFEEATIVDCRWVNKTCVNLYHVEGPAGGFFVEVHYDTPTERIVRVCSFKDVPPLAE